MLAASVKLKPVRNICELTASYLKSIFTFSANDLVFHLLRVEVNLAVLWISFSLDLKADFHLYLVPRSKVEKKSVLIALACDILLY